MGVVPRLFRYAGGIGALDGDASSDWRYGTALATLPSRARKQLSALHGANVEPENSMVAGRATKANRRPNGCDSKPCGDFIAI